MSELETSRTKPIWRYAASVGQKGVVYLPGISFCLLLVLGSSYISDHYGTSKILGALLLGMAFQNISQYQEFSPGLDFCTKTVLRVGVAILGVRISFSQMEELGGAPLILVSTVVIGTIIFSIVIARLFQIDRIRGIISGAAVGICGVSAALAVASVLPSNKVIQQHLLCTVVAVTGISTICMVLYPGLLTTMGMTPEQMGLFIGASIHDVVQVFGAGEMISADVAELATYTKMLRVAMLVPTVVILALVYRRSGVAADGVGRIVPPFLVAFVGFVILANVQLLPREGTVLLADISQACLWIAMAALGAKTNLVELWHVGGKPLLLILINTLFIATISLLLIIQIDAGG